MRISILSAAILLASLHCVAQRDIPSFGKADRNELTMTSCSFEPTASAMKIFDVQEVEFEIFSYGGIKLKTERRVRIKVFNEKGYSHANIRIPYLSKKGIAKIKNLAGAIYTLEPDGNIRTRTLQSKDFFRDKAMENLGMVTFTFPKLSPGSVIEYRYTTVENNILSVDPWIIQGDIPVGYTSFRIQTPVKTFVKEKIFGSDKIEQFTELIKYDQFRRTTYHKSDIPSFIEEPFMSSVKDHLVKVNFMLLPDGSTFDMIYEASGIWHAAGQRLLRSKYMETQIGKVIPGTESIIDSAKKLANGVDRIAFLYQSMQNKFPTRIEQTAKSEDLTEAWKENDATSSEINLILLNLLEKADIKSVPVLVSTRENGYIDKQFPSLGQFNGVNIMAFDSNRYFLLDATIKNLSYDIPPENMLNREVFVLSPDSMSWVTIKDDRPLFRQSASIIADMMPDGTIEGGTSVQYFDYAKSARLDSMSNREGKGRNIETGIPGYTISNQHLEAVTRLDEPLFETWEFKFQPNTSDDFLFIDPQVLIGKTKNPFIKETRATDIDFGCNQLLVATLQINLNNHFDIDHLPPSTIIRAPDSSFFFKVNFSSSGGKVYMTQMFETKKSLFSSYDYAGIRDFFRQVFTLMAREIILKKKA